MCRRMASRTRLWSGAPSLASPSAAARFAIRVSRVTPAPSQPLAGGRIEDMDVLGPCRDMNQFALVRDGSARHARPHGNPAVQVEVEDGRVAKVLDEFDLRGNPLGFDPHGSGPD